MKTRERGEAGEREREGERLPQGMKLGFSAERESREAKESARQVDEMIRRHMQTVSDVLMTLQEEDLLDGDIVVLHCGRVGGENA